jgi:phosphopantetheine adenylyltransferase
MLKNFKLLILCIIALLAFGSLSSCSGPAMALNDLDDESEISDTQDMHRDNTNASKAETKPRIDSVRRVMNPKHPDLHWTSIKILRTKGTILDENDSIILVQYFVDGELRIDESRFKRGIYTLYISDTIGNILSEKFISR